MCIRDRVEGRDFSRVEGRDFSRVEGRDFSRVDPGKSIQVKSQVYQVALELLDIFCRLLFLDLR